MGVVTPLEDAELVAGVIVEALEGVVVAEFAAAELGEVLEEMVLEAVALEAVVFEEVLVDISAVSHQPLLS